MVPGLWRWPQVCRVKITFGSLSTNFFVSTKTEFDEILCSSAPNMQLKHRDTNPYTGLPIY